MVVLAACVGRSPQLQQQQQQQRRRRTIHRRTAVMQAPSGGFGRDSSSTGSGGPASAPKGWTRIASLSEIPAERRSLPVVVSSVLSVMVFWAPSGRLFCSDANSTAFKFPLTDATLVEGDGLVTIEVPFDGTIYNLETGEVISWCPTNNPLRFVLGKLKESVSPEPLKVYPVMAIQGGEIHADFRS